MVIMTAKVPKRKVLVIALVVLAAVLVLTLCLHGAKSGANSPEQADAQGKTNESRIAFLAGFGWQVEPEPLETLQIKLPADLKGYEDYLALQTEQGLPFADCGGKVVCRYTYRVTNYPGGRRDAQVNLLQCDGAVVAGDVVLLGEDGGVFGLEFPK